MPCPSSTTALASHQRSLAPPAAKRVYLLLTRSLGEPSGLESQPSIGKTAIAFGATLLPHPHRMSKGETDLFQSDVNIQNVDFLYFFQCMKIKFFVRRHCYFLIFFKNIHFLLY